MILVPLMGSIGVFLLFAGLTSQPHLPGRRPALDHGMIGRSSAAFLAGAGVAFAMTRSIPLSLVIGALAGSLPSSRSRRERIRRVRAAQEAWPEVLSSLVSYLRSGTSLGDALVRLADRAPANLGASLALYGTAYRASGNLVEALGTLRDSARDPITDRICVALTVAHEVGGGDLVRVLISMSESLRQELRTRREVEARWSWTVSAARLAAAAPWVVLGLMSTKPEARGAYSSAEGLTLIVVCAVVTGIGYALMLRAGRLAMPERSLR